MSQPAFQQKLDLRAAPALAAARKYSEALLQRIQGAFSARRDAFDAIETVAIGGSLGRLEAHPQSDFDCLIVARDRARARAVAEQVDLLWRDLAAFDLRPPKITGIYRTATRRCTFIDDAALGSLDETPQIFGQRMQFLLDARVLMDAEAFVKLRNEIVAWYGRGFHARQQNASWTYLINDLGRYLHSYAAWQQYKFARSNDDSWQLRQAKFRTSRVITFAGLLCLLGESNLRDDKQTWVASELDKTPLERLELVMARYPDADFAAILKLYEHTFSMLSNELTRAALVRGGPGHVSELNRGLGQEYQQIRASSEALMQRLSGFVLARHGDWDPRFFARLLF